MHDGGGGGSAAAVPSTSGGGGGGGVACGRDGGARRVLFTVAACVCSALVTALLMSSRAPLLMHGAAWPVASTCAHGVPALAAADASGVRTRRPRPLVDPAQPQNQQPERHHVAGVATGAAHDALPVGRCVGELVSRASLPGPPARYVEQKCSFDRGVLAATQRFDGAHGWRPFPDYENANDRLALANLPDVPCACPLLDSFECATWDAQIAHDLAPWINVTLTSDVFDQPFEFYDRAPIGYRVRVRGGRLELSVRGDVSAYHDGFRRELHELVRRVPSTPDVDLVGHMWDHPKVPNQDPIPMFGQMKRVDSNDILLPLWESSGFPGLQCTKPLEERIPKAYFRGGCSGPELGYQNRFWPYYRRNRVGRISHLYPDEVDAAISEGEPCMRRYASDDTGEMERVQHEQAPYKQYEAWGRSCDYRYVLVLDGNTAAHRLKYLLKANTVVFLQHSVFYEFYHFLLRPYVHYVPVSSNLENLVEQVRWANAHPQVVAQIAKNAVELADKYLTHENHLCYLHRVLQLLASKQPEA